MRSLNELMLTALPRFARRRIAVSSFGVLVALAGCGSDAATSPDGAVRVTVSPAWITHATVADANGRHVRFAVDAAIHNDGATDVQLTTPVGCGSPIERRSGSDWVPAIASGFIVCTLAQPVVVAAHTILPRHFFVDVPLPDRPLPDVPQWTAPEATGVYRVHFIITTTGPALTALGDSESASPPFVIID